MKFTRTKYRAQSNSKSVWSFDGENVFLIRGLAYQGEGYHPDVNPFTGYVDEHESPDTVEVDSGSYHKTSCDHKNLIVVDTTTGLLEALPTKVFYQLDLASPGTEEVETLDDMVHY